MDRNDAAREGLDSGKLESRLAAQIVERSRHLGLPVGTHLKEQELADAFRVSRTPIRLALNVLASMDLVESRPNRGFFLKQAAEPNGNGDGLLAAPEGASEDPLYLQIAQDRLKGLLETRVAEAEMARRYGATRARIVRILARMAEEGWLARLPGHGWEFQPTLTSPQAYDQGYRFRMLIEPAAVREQGYRLDPDILAQTRVQQHAMLDGGIQHWSRSETFTANSVFHEIVVAGAQNPFLLEGLRRVNRLRRLLEYRTHERRSRLVQECKDHLALLGMLEAGKTEKAADFLYDHLDRARISKAGLVEAALNASTGT